MILYNMDSLLRSSQALHSFSPDNQILLLGNVFQLENKLHPYEVLLMQLEEFCHLPFYV